MKKEEKHELAQDALRYLVQLLPPEEYGEDERCDVIEYALQILASDGDLADVRISCLQDVWQKWCDSKTTKEFDEWLHDEMHEA
ncbi:MAG: hypothetical protein RLN88_04185 [Ekhidna sp.]|uniref:hypothetical protein n=1 Tax=Ekhidna sp. TaxID=2608089 RepID=UPI0032EBB816